MVNSIEQNTYKLLKALSEMPRDDWVDGPGLAEATGLDSNHINDAVTLLEQAGYVEWIRAMGTAPYEFSELSITARGRYELERVEKETEGNKQLPQRDIRPPSPVGSPYGFLDEDWEAVSARKADSDTLYVVFGFQFESEHYDSEKLKKNVEGMMSEAVDAYLQLPTSVSSTLDFRPLAAGYGGHLFNEIVRDVIGSDIAVFDTSDLNPNVMLEMGVALTWGIRVLPIKKEGCPKPPSDISGQTWADYNDSASNFVDNDHHRKLIEMVKRAVTKKRH